MLNIFKNIYRFLFFVIIDQISKSFLIIYLEKLPNKRLNILKNFDLVHVWNYGISFGAFGSYKFSNLIFFVINFFIIVYLLISRIKSKNNIQNFAYDLIIGGAIGNLIDRVLRGGVFDFIYLHYKDYGFPIFNGADTFIFLGVALIIYENIIYEKHKKSIA